MKDVITNKLGLSFNLEHKNTAENSRVFCDKIEYIHKWQRYQGIKSFHHYLRFWSGEEIVFVVSLRTNKVYKNIDAALEDVGITRVPGIWDDCKTKKQKAAFKNNLDYRFKTQKSIPLDKAIQWINQQNKKKAKKKVIQNGK